MGSSFIHLIRTDSNEFFFEIEILKGAGWLKWENHQFSKKGIRCSLKKNTSVDVTSIPGQIQEQNI